MLLYMTHTAIYYETGAPTMIVNDVNVIKQYACVQGLVAVDKAAMSQVQTPTAS